MMTQKAGRRTSLRLTGYDYASPGTYFVTVCVQDRACVLGEIDRDEVVVSHIGQMVESWWGSISQRFPSVGIDAYVVMRNHLHGLLRFGRNTSFESEAVGIGKGRHGGLPLQKTIPNAMPIAETSAVVRRGKPPCLPLHTTTSADSNQPVQLTLGKVIQCFKSATTNDYKVGVDLLGWPPYPGRLWQRNYYEHIVRDERELDRIREYIAGNPSRWAEDDDYRETCPGFA